MLYGNLKLNKKSKNITKYSSKWQVYILPYTICVKSLLISYI